VQLQDSRSQEYISWEALHRCGGNALQCMQHPACMHIRRTPNSSVQAVISVCNTGMHSKVSFTDTAAAAAAASCGGSRNNSNSNVNRIPRNNNTGMLLQCYCMQAGHAAGLLAAALAAAMRVHNHSSLPMQCIVIATVDVWAFSRLAALMLLLVHLQQCTCVVLHTCTLGVSGLAAMLTCTGAETSTTPAFAHCISPSYLLCTVHCTCTTDRHTGVLYLPPASDHHSLLLCVAVRCWSPSLRRTTMQPAK
jgi:hypothetical protein